MIIDHVDVDLRSCLLQIWKDSANKDNVDLSSVPGMIGL